MGPAGLCTTFVPDAHIVQKRDGAGNLTQSSERAAGALNG